MKNRNKNKIFRNKLGDVNWFLIITIVTIAGFVVLLYFLFVYNPTGSDNKAICHNSVILKATTKGFSGNLNCKTDYVCISGGGKCSDITPDITIKVNPKNKNEIYKTIANQMTDCWSTYGEGKLDYADVSFGTACAVCSVVKFDDKIQKQYTGENCIFHQTKTDSSLDLLQYDNYKSIFEKYNAPASNNALIPIITPNEFKALLAAIAQENKWGGDSVSNPNGDYLMGYPFTDQTSKSNYQGADNQIKTVSSIITNVLIGEKNINPLYVPCVYHQNDNLETDLHCILNVLKTEKADSKEGNKYADEVLAFWDKWKDYLETITFSLSSVQYNNYKSIFEKYSQQNLPDFAISAGSGRSTSWTSNDFNALLIAIAQENNWGGDSVSNANGDYLMGYPFTDQTYKQSYKGADTQIRTVSGILKSVLEGDISSPSSEYNFCISTTVLKDRLHCVLSVLKTDKTDTSGNTAGNKYADEVLTLSGKWKDYLSSNTAKSATSSDTATSPSTCLTYYELFSYLAKTKIETSGGTLQQTYLSYLFANKDIETLLSYLEKYGVPKEISVTDKYMVRTAQTDVTFGGAVIEFLFGKTTIYHLLPQFVSINHIPTAPQCKTFITKS